MTITITTVRPDSGPLWKIPLCRVDTCSPESGYCPRKVHYKNCLAKHSFKPHSRAVGLLSTLMQCPPPDMVGSPDPPAPSQDTYSAPLQAGAGSSGSRPGQGQTVFPDLGGAVDSLAPLHQSLRLWRSPLAASLRPRARRAMCSCGGVDDLRNFPVPPEHGQESVGLGGRSRECRHSEG